MVMLLGKISCDVMACNGGHGAREYVSWGGSVRKVENTDASYLCGAVLPIEVSQLQNAAAEVHGL